MARAKVTNADIFARLARGECANYRQNGCRGQSPCTIIVGEPCDYFNRYVKPLLDYPEFSTKYQREAKVTVAINPNAKVVRARRTSSEPRLTLETTSAKETAPRASKPAPARVVKSTPQIPAPAPVAIPTPKVAKKTKKVEKTVTPDHVETPLKATKPLRSAKPSTHPTATVPTLSLIAPELDTAVKKSTAHTTKAVAVKKPAASISSPAPQLELELVPTKVPVRKTVRKR